MGVKEFLKAGAWWKKGIILGLILSFLERVYIYLKHMEYYVDLSLTKIFLLFITDALMSAFYYCIIFGFIGLSVDLFLKTKPISIEGWKGFFKPSIKKVLISLLLAGISIFIGLIPLLPAIVFPFYFMMLLLFNIPLFEIIVLVLLAYPFGCYINKNKKWARGILLYLVASVIISAGIYFGITIYNNNWGNFCNTDSDCSRQCNFECTTHSYRHLCISDPLTYYMCAGGLTVCENHRCVTKEDSYSDLAIICATDVVVNIESVCKSGNDYKISIKNDGSKDIVKWKVRLYEDESKVDVIDSNEGIPMFGIGKITVTPSKINELRKVEVTPTIKTADKEVTCAQNIGFYGDVEGSSITEECDK